MTTWFKHRHFWRPITATNTIIEPETRMTTGSLLVQGCSCGVVRTIEISPGKQPVVRYASYEGSDHQ